MIIKTYPVGDLQTNCYIVGDENTKIGAIIDPGAESKYLLEQISSLGLAIKAILLTHGHFDHVGAVADIAETLGIPLWCHGQDSEYVTDCVRQGSSFGIYVERAPKKIDCEYVDGQQLDIGPLSFQVLHTPGHTPGGVTLVLGKNAFTGDSLFRGSIGRTDFVGGNHRQLIDSIRTKIFALPDDTIIYPGHGPKSTIAYEKDNNPFVK